VGDRFLLKPLLPLLTEDGIFYVLAISENQARLFEGTRHHIGEIHLEGLPAHMTAALAMRGRDPGQLPHRRWQGDEGQKVLYRKYFLQIDRALRPLYGNFSDPLVIAGVDYLVPIFREASSYRHLVAAGISGNPEHLGAQELHAKAWPIVEPVLAEPRRAALERYHALRGTDRVSDDLETVMTAALDGRVESLFLNLAVTISGVFDPAIRSAVVHDTPQPGDVDLSAAAARWAYRTGAEIFAGEPPAVPEGSSIAAVFRYA
jgi:Bacterial archaeo-eukaryotic release factor family 3